MNSASPTPKCTSKKLVVLTYGEVVDVVEVQSLHVVDIAKYRA